MSDYILPIGICALLAIFVLVFGLANDKKLPDEIKTITYEMGVVKEIVGPAEWPHKSTNEVKIKWLSDSIVELEKIEDVWNVGDTLRLKRFKYELIQKEQ